MSPHVSVVVPTRNRLATLQQALRSILGQQAVDVEVIVVDEGSSDDTPAWLATLDHRVRTVRHDRPHGLPAARNAGWQRAAGRWVAFCDDDDVWAPDKLVRQLAAVDAAPASRWVVGGALLVDPQLRVIGHQPAPPSEALLDQLLASNVVPGGGSGTMVERQLLVDAGGFHEELRASEDWDLWIRLAAWAPAAVVDRPLLGYRIWTGSMSTDEPRMRTSHRAVRRRHGALALARQAAPDHAVYERFLARQHANAGARLAAARCFVRSGILSHQPTDIVRALAVVTSPPSFTQRGRRRALGRIPQEWRHGAEAWLAPLRTTGSDAVAAPA